MPRYEFRCRTCASTFEVDRPMQASGDPADCPAGHGDTVKLLSTVALGGDAAKRSSTGRTGRSGGSSAPAMAPAGGGGCCGGGCCGGG